MNSFELNKVLGAILFTCLCLLAINIAAGAIFAPQVPSKPGYMIEVKAAPEGGAGEKKEPEKPIGVLLASASPEKGQAAAKQCQACHTFEKGGPNRVGPNLWDVVGNDRGEGRDGFAFSDAMKKKGGKWTYEELNEFLKNPRGYIPGTKMTFAGISRDSQRADVIDYLHTLSDSPKPLPKAEAQAPAAAPAPGGAPAQQAKPQPGKPQPPAQPKAPSQRPAGAPAPGATQSTAPQPKPPLGALGTHQQGQPQPPKPEGNASPAPSSEPPQQAAPQPGNAGAQPNAKPEAAPPKQ